MTGFVSCVVLCRCCKVLLLVCEDIPMGMQPQPRRESGLMVVGSCIMLPPKVWSDFARLR